MTYLRQFGPAWCAGVAAAVAALVFAGCEPSGTSEDAITITPSATSLVDGVGTVLFTASVGSNAPTLYLPLEWTVSDPDLGHILSSAGLSAVYVGGGRIGHNSVTVRDRAEAEGIAVVYQPD